MKQEQTKKLKPKKNALRIVVLGTFCLALIFMLCIPLIRTGLDIYQKYQEYDRLETQLSQLKETEAELTIDVKKMQDPEYIGRLLREKFMYSRDGEYVIRIPE